MNLKIFAFVLAAPLAACSTAERTTLVPQVQPFAQVAIPKAQPMVMHAVEWKVYNLAELEKLIEQLKKEGKTDFVIFALTPDGYKALSNNMIEIERFVREQKEITIMLRRIIDGRSKRG